jgi:hypothetical protein
VNQEFHRLSSLSPHNTACESTGPEGSVKQRFKWLNDILYVDTENWEDSLSVLECRESKPDRDGGIATTTFRWATNLHVTQKNAGGVSAMEANPMES